MADTITKEGMEAALNGGKKPTAAEAAGVKEAKKAEVPAELLQTPKQQQPVADPFERRKFELQQTIQQFQQQRSFLAGQIAGFTKDLTRIDEDLTAANARLDEVMQLQKHFGINQPRTS